MTIRELSDAKVIPEFAMDQYGSRYLHTSLDSASDEDTNIVFMKLLPQAAELTTDVFGNFVLQKLLEIGSVEVKRVFAEQLVGDVLRLSLHAHGCRVIQKVSLRRFNKFCLTLECISLFKCFLAYGHSEGP